MKRMLLLGAGLVALAGCGGSPGPVGENSADSITTTAVGNVVATQPTPTPTPTDTATPADDNGAMADDSGAAEANAAASHDVTADDGTSHGDSSHDN